MDQSSLGWIAVFIAALGYGSLFVPVKNYEVYDGLVYQWFQCCGVVLCGIIYACWQNDWDAAGMSAPGFYVCREGLVSGMIFQFANVLATQSVKLFGMGNYFTTHEVTNLGGAFFFGVFGKSLGIPSTPPSKPALALLGFVFVLLGMLPVGMTEPETAAAGDEDGKDAPPPRASSWHGVGNPQTAESPSRAPRGLFSRLFGALRTDQQPTPSRQRSQHHIARFGVGDAGLLLMQEDEEDLDEIEEEQAQPSGVADSPEKAQSAPLLLRGMSARTPPESGAWFAGLALSLLAGLVFSFMYVPLLPWTQRMRDQDLAVSSFDYFFSISVGLFLASTAYMIIGGAWKKYRGQKMQKSVLRPALLTGVMWSVASMAQLYALSVIPYAVGYCLVCGGGLAVSLLWGVLVFNEASTPHNFRCTVASFVGVLFGMVLVALAK